MTISVRVSDKPRESPFQCLGGPPEVVQGWHVSPLVYPPVGYPVPVLAVQELELIGLVYAIVQGDVPSTEESPALVTPRPASPVLHGLVRRGIRLPSYRATLIPDYGISSGVDMEDIRPSGIRAHAEVIPRDSVQSDYRAYRASSLAGHPVTHEATIGQSCDYDPVGIRPVTIHRLANHPE